jgi:uncharacterized protein
VSTTGDLLVALVIAIGLVGIVVPVLPGTILVAAAIVVWAGVDGGTGAWTVAVISMAVLAGASLLKYLVPARTLRDSEIPTSTLLLGAMLGIAGFFVVPVVGLPLGFVAGVYVAELTRVGARQAWPSTVTALKALGLAMLIELAGGMIAALVWLAGVVTLG